MKNEATKSKILMPVLVMHIGCVRMSAASTSDAYGHAYEAWGAHTIGTGLGCSIRRRAHPSCPVMRRKRWHPRRC